MYQEDTIAAVATPPGEGGVAIVRISGPDAERIASTLFKPKVTSNSGLKSHTLYHGEIIRPGTNQRFDEVLLAVMRKPRSYTGEDVVEIHCHGGIFLVRQILGLVLAQGARHAEPGEFTKRAFLNGRLDLSQAEAILDLIRARTSKGVEIALDQANGELSRWVLNLRQEVLAILAQVEASIDFSEEDIELLQRSELIIKIESLRTEIGDILATYEWGRLHREGAKVCICGRPNVGKSSLLNALLGEQRAIVTAVPGTTRDVIEEAINLDGLPVVLWDTAGIRDSEDHLEKLGVDLSRRHVEKADVIVLVLDGSRPASKDDLALLSCLPKKKILIVINKSDLPQLTDVDEVRRNGKTSTIASISATTGAGIANLKNVLKETILGCPAESPIILANLRHKSALERCKNLLSETIETISQNRSPEFVALEVREAKEALEEIVGVISNDNILESIFENFCIGK